MSRSGRDFVGLLPSQDQQPRNHFFGPGQQAHFIRNQLSTSTWLCLGAIAQGALILLAGRIALLPAVLVVLYRAFDAYAMTVGWRHNPYMDDVILKKFSAQFPDSEGRYGNTPSNNDVVVLLIGTRCNHPMGLLAPGFKQLGDFFGNMSKDLDKHSEEFGFLGMTSWLNSSERETKPEFMAVCYFRTTEGLHAFAHSEYHLNAWDWWYNTIKEPAHLSIWHEIYHAPKGHWESIYANSHPTGINSTTFKVFDQETGTEKWASPVVDASKGLLRTSAGRMNRSKNGGEEHAYLDEKK